MQHGSQAKSISQSEKLCSSLIHFRCPVPWCSPGAIHKFARSCYNCYTEVRNLSTSGDDMFAVEENIFWFEISMSDMSVMEVHQSCAHVLEHNLCFFTKTTLQSKEVMQRLCHLLQNYRCIFRLLNRLVPGNKIWML